MIIERGDIWLTEFAPARGQEIGKTRPAIVLSVADIGKLDLRIVIPLTDWKERYSDYTWFARIEPTRGNGLSKTSGADAFQCKSFSLERFKKKLGKITGDELNEIAACLALCIGLE